MSRELKEGEEMPPAEFRYRILGPVAEHNYKCAVCRDLPAVLETWWGVLQPCWECQERGFTRVQKLKKGSLARWVFKNLIEDRP